MRLVVAGKGGTGKTTISGTIARVLARAGRDVLAVDADTNPNLAAIIGIEPTRARSIVTLPRDLLERRTASDGSTRTVFAADPDALITEYAERGPDGVRLLVMGRVDHGGAG